jgi:integrase/recombinase XerD
VRLRTAIKIYVERKKLSGLRYTKSEQTLRALARHVGNPPLGAVASTQVFDFLNGPRTSATTWRHKFGQLRKFFEYWQFRDHLDRLPLPRMRPPSAQTFIPYIYSKSELRIILNATSLSQKGKSCMVDAPTFRTLLLFLYGTGMLLGEAMRLLRDDVDLHRGIITVRGWRFGRLRKIPIGPDLQRILKGYSAARNSATVEGRTYFVNKLSQPINDVTLSKSFQRLRRIAGISRNDGGCYQPRIHDIRHTFAVHRLTAWYKQGLDVHRMLPALSAYMGFVCLDAAERYLTMTPERLRKQLSKLSLGRKTLLIGEAKGDFRRS